MRHVTLVALALLAASCGSDPTDPSPAADTVTLGAVTPGSGSVVVIPPSFPYFDVGGVVLPRGSNVLSVDVSMTVGRPVPRAQLNVYLLTGGSSSDYCGQNLPDAPAWTAVPAGWTASHRVGGFQVFRLPCDVTGVRAVLHTRDSRLLTPPLPSETIAEATAAVRWELRR
jgi:hypothetical protein